MHFASKAPERFRGTLGFNHVYTLPKIIAKIDKEIQTLHFFSLEMIPSRNRLINTIPVVNDIWELSLDFILKHDLPYVTNIVRLFIGELENNQYEIGGRIPAVYVQNKKLLVRFSTDTNPNHSLDIPIVLNKNYHLKIRQLVTSDNKFLVKQVILDGDIIETVKHGRFSMKFKNVKFFFCDKLHKPAPVRVSNLRYTSNLLYQGMWICFKSIFKWFCKDCVFFSNCNLNQMEWDGSCYVLVYMSSQDKSLILKIKAKNIFGLDL